MRTIHLLALAAIAALLLPTLCCTDYADYYGPGGEGLDYDSGNGPYDDSDSSGSLRGEVNPLGPENTVVRAMAADEKYLFIGTDSGELLFSALVADPPKWTSLGSVPEAVSALAISPRDSELLIALDRTSDTLIYRFDDSHGLIPSDDGIVDGGPVLQIGVESGNDDMFVLTPRALYVSADNGVTWERRLHVADVGCADFYKMAIHPLLPQSIFIIGLCDDRPTVLRTLNGGRLFNSIELPAPAGEEAWCLAASTDDPLLLVAGGRRGVWSSSDLGSSWSIERSSAQWALNFDASYSRHNGKPLFVGLEAVHYRLLLLMGNQAGTAWQDKIVDGYTGGNDVLCPSTQLSKSCFVGTEGSGVVSLMP
ncbi:MAG: hypothetical protein P9M14_01825 [Candidatus Alcyoniella australis]|nr:hypothetical protein [Candidatus Alcyoniella australis]